MQEDENEYTIEYGIHSTLRANELETSGMNKGKSIEIFKQIERDEFTEEEKSIAICEVIKMATHNSITKAEMLNVIKWMFNEIYEVSDE